ncbi:Phenylalanine ammonia-lyase [Grifola frondosa]|uniref:Phenylalanine ammonia-lyase n=1 Tax=Grifola frondosa TaxID=5627 RepID=A0A1C7LY54_GRIFR|nr:Phenylalanine ammonia-lyase [Grifola frondosa]
MPVSILLNNHSPSFPLTSTGSFSRKKSSGIVVPAVHVEEERTSGSALLSRFIDAHRQLQAYKSGKPVSVDGHTLSIPAVTAVARHSAAVALDDSAQSKERVAKSRRVIVHKVDCETSVYGVSTGFGGSADTRTNDPLALGHALLQHQQTGVLPSQTDVPPSVLPLLDPLMSTSMPESWVRGAILIRMNSLIRGHSGVRWELIEKMGALLSENITPLVPLRGSISASGDLSPLSYIAGVLIGNPSIRVFDGPSTCGARRLVSSREALAAHNIEPIPLASKEHLGILNGTAFSASVAALALHDAAHLALLAQVCTAMGTEAMLGARGSFAPFIHAVARPHPGQVEVASNIDNLLTGSQFAVSVEEEKHISDDIGELRQDRYPLRASAQFLGPQVEDILAALESVTLECNSTTDNPLIDAETGEIHHGGNFQAMAVTNAMEKTRLALHHIGKLLFAQCTELMNPAMNRGLPPNLAATDPSLNYHTKGIDIHTAAYVGELGYLANPVSTHIQSAEMHNQAVNSLALISARATINSLEVLSLLTASYLYTLCQALDLRAMHNEFQAGLDKILFALVSRAIMRELETTSTMDALPRMTKVAAATTTPLVDFCMAHASLAALDEIVDFRARVAAQAAALLLRLRQEYLEGKRGGARQRVPREDSADVRVRAGDAGGAHAWVGKSGEFQEWAWGRCDAWTQGPRIYPDIWHRVIYYGRAFVAALQVHIEGL